MQNSSLGSLGSGAVQVVQGIPGSRQGHIDPCLSQKPPEARTEKECCIEGGIWGLQWGEVATGLQAELEGEGR